MLKKILISLSLLSSFAVAKPLVIEQYINYTGSYSVIESRKILDAEPLVNIVGGDSYRNELRYGVTGNMSYDKTAYKATVYGYLWLNGKEKNNERGIGVGINYQTGIYSHRLPIRFNLNAQAGIGYQPVSGDTFHTDTDVSTASYVGSQAYGTAGYNAIYDKNTNVVEMNLGLGLAYDISKNICLTLDYRYIRKAYDFAYTVEGATYGTSLSGVIQDNHDFGIGLSYSF